MPSGITPWGSDDATPITNETENMEEPTANREVSFLYAIQYHDEPTEHTTPWKPQIKAELQLSEL